MTAARRADTERLTSGVRDARDLMDREFATPLTLDRLAFAAGYSKYHFARAFTSVYGESPRSYLMRRRIERAKDLLRAANLTVTEVAALVGFESLGTFSARFKRLVGESPSAYARRAGATGGTARIPGCVLMMWTRPVASTEERNREEAAPPASSYGWPDATRTGEVP